MRAFLPENYEINSCQRFMDKRWRPISCSIHAMARGTR